MPKLWTDTVDAHRQAVRQATLDAVEHLVHANGLPGVTMSELAKEAGIGRATLYKYFPDLKAVLSAWHERHVSAHMNDLHQILHGSGGALDRLTSVLRMHAQTHFRRQGSEIAAMLHADDQVRAASQHLHEAVASLLDRGAAAGEFRDDVPADELATFCLAAVEGASQAKSQASTSRLVELAISAVRSRAGNS